MNAAIFPEARRSCNRGSPSQNAIYCPSTKHGRIAIWYSALRFPQKQRRNSGRRHPPPALTLQRMPGDNWRYLRNGLDRCVRSADPSARHSHEAARARMNSPIFSRRRNMPCGPSAAGKPRNDYRDASRVRLQYVAPSVRFAGWARREMRSTGNGRESQPLRITSGDGRASGRGWPPKSSYAPPTHSRED